MKSGVYHDIGNDAYHASAGVSNSGLGDILRSPRHYYALHIDPSRPERAETLPQQNGTLAHCAILEPDAFAERYFVGPDARRGSKPWKDAEAEADGREIIKPEQRETAFRQRDAVLRLPDVADALSSGRPEVSAWWKDEQTGVLCRCRPDWVHEAGTGVILLDVKTCGDASPAEFARQIARMGYHRQAAFYSDGYAAASGRPVLAFIFVAVEQGWPHGASAVMLDDEALDAGRRQYRRALETYARCINTDTWPGYPPGIELISLPVWALAE